MSRRPSRQLSEQEREERRARDRERMRLAIEQLRRSDAWIGWLRARRRLHRYSLTNTLLILSQKPDATHVAGFKTWLELGYVVRKGATKLWIWKPVPPSKHAMAAWRESGADPDNKPPTRFVLRPLVFDRSDVEPLEGRTPAPLEPPVSAITGDDQLERVNDLVDFAGTLGHAVRLLEGMLPNGADALVNHQRREIQVAGRDGRGHAVAANAKVCALIHELAHVLVHAERERLPDELRLSYAEEEMVVESVAFTVTAGIGLDTSANSVPYVASWAESASLELLEQRAGLIDGLARRIEVAVLQDDRRDDGEGTED